MIGLGSRSSDDIVRLAAENLRQDEDRVDVRAPSRNGADLSEHRGHQSRSGENPEASRDSMLLNAAIDRAMCASVEDVPPWLWARLIRSLRRVAFPTSDSRHSSRPFSLAVEEQVGLSVSNAHGQKATAGHARAGGVPDRPRNDRLFVPTVVATAPEDVWWGWSIHGA